MIEDIQSAGDDAFDLFDIERELVVKNLIPQLLHVSNVAYVLLFKINAGNLLAAPQRFLKTDTLELARAQRVVRS